MMNSSSKPLIRYYPDYDLKGEFEKKSFQINTPGSRAYMEFAYAHGDSVEFLIRECFDALEDIRGAIPGGWNAPRRFEELKQVLKGEAREYYDEIVAQDYPNPANKTNPNYLELRRKIITRISDHPYPGDKIHTFISQGIKYVRCKMQDGTGRFEKPDKVLNRMQRIRTMGASMHHNHGALYMSDDDFKQHFWNIFPENMRSWLENDQDNDPFDPANPMDVQEIADAMQRYWNMNFKVKKEKKDGGQAKRKRDDDEDDGDDRQNNRSNKRRRGNDRNNDNRGNRNRGGNRNEGRKDCRIAGHEKHYHNWAGCFLNPYSRKYNAEDARQFFETQANQDNAWYRDVYLNATSSSNRGRDYNQEGRGYGRGGRGGGRGQGRGGGRGQGRGGYHQNQGQQYHYHGQNHHHGHDHYHYQGQGPSGPPMNQAPPMEHYHYAPPAAPAANAAPSAPAAPAAPTSAYARGNQQGQYSWRRI